MALNHNNKALMNKNKSVKDLLESQIRVDLHCHSLHSDGTLTPEQVAQNLYNFGVRYAALTDHNTLAGLLTFRQALSQYGIGYISGIEITTEHKNKVIHLLAYGFDIDNHKLVSLLNSKEYKNRTSEYLQPQSFLTAAEIIKLIHEAGGIVSLAHPLQTEPDSKKLKNLISDLKDLGLDGIEAIYSSNTPDNEVELLNLSTKKNLLITAGTDYHSPKEGYPGMVIEKNQWEDFRDALLRASSDFVQDSAQQAMKLPKTHKNPWFSFVMNILLPASLSLILFIFALFVFLIPYFEDTLLDRKRENIRQLTQVAWGVLDEAAYEVTSGLVSLEQAQDLAKKRIAAMRYGEDNKDYFWIQDTSPQILMHPYRIDLNNQDVSDYKDAQGTRIFVEFSELALNEGEGYFSYVWQWMDDTDRVEPKESYIRLYEPWGWVIGTGIYINDVHLEILNLRNYIVKISFTVIFIVLLLLIYIIRQGLLLEKSRNKAEKLLLESIDRYQALSEAATEGALFIYNGRCRYANTVMYELLNCTPDKIELLNINDVFPDIKVNKEWLTSLSNKEVKNETKVIKGVLRRCDSSLLSCNFSLKSGLNNLTSGFMILAKRTDDLSEHTGSHTALNRLLHIPTGIASDLTKSIKNSLTMDEVIDSCKKKVDLVVSLLENGTSSIAIASLISIISDLVTQKIVDLSIDKIGNPPVPFVFLALGSHGRHSQTLFSDQDNAIVYKLSDKDDEKSVAKYFLELGNIICYKLELAGFHKCIGEKMASNPKWNKPLSVWKLYFEEWIRNSEPQQVVEFSIMFDFRPVAGDFEITTELRDFIFTEIKETPFFISQVAQNALLFKTPMRLFGNIVTTGGKNHKGRIDVKTPAMAIVTFARLYAMKNTINETSTLLQLDTIKSLGIILDSKHRDIVAALETLIRLRLWNQVLSIKSNQQLDNWIDPDQLSHLEETILIECFKEIDDLHNLIERDFLA